MLIPVCIIAFFGGLTLLFVWGFGLSEDEQMLKQPIFLFFLALWLFIISSIFEHEQYAVPTTVESQTIEIQETKIGDKVFQYYVNLDVDDELQHDNFEIIDGTYDVEKFHVIANLVRYEPVNWLGDYEVYRYEVVER